MLNDLMAYQGNYLFIVSVKYSSNFVDNKSVHSFHTSELLFNAGNTSSLLLLWDGFKLSRAKELILKHVVRRDKDFQEKTSNCDDYYQEDHKQAKVVASI